MGAPQQCADIFLKPSRALDRDGMQSDIQMEFQRALAQGKELMNMQNPQREALLRELFPAGFLLHGTAVPVVELALSHQGRFYGSRTISTNLWSNSTELSLSRLRKNLKEYRTFYFSESAPVEFFQQALRDAASYARFSGNGFHALKEITGEVEVFAELSQIMGALVNGDWSTLESVRDSGEDYFSAAQIAKVDEVLRRFGEPELRVYDESKKREGVLLIFSRNALKKVRHYHDVETGSRFFLFPPKKSLNLSDVLAIIPLSDIDLADLEEIQAKFF